MHAKLRGKLAANLAERPQKDAFDSAESAVARPPLEWLDPAPGSRGYYDTGKRYSICSITMAGHEFWETWKLAGGGAWFHQIAVGLKTEAQARAAAEADARVK